MKEYKPSKALKSLVDVGKKETRVLGSVERHIISRPKDQSRRTDVLHPSDMAGKDWCYRASYYHLIGRTPVNNRNMTLSLAAVFEEGHDIHAKWQRWFQEMGVLYGKWYCPECDAPFFGGVDCHEGALQYREVPLYYAPLRISGHADGWIVGLGEPLMLEIKSLGIGTIRFEDPGLLKEYDNDFEKIWDNLNAPFQKHITQVQIYMKLAELLKMPDYPQEAVIIYEAKPNQKMKEFVVPKSDFGITELFSAAEMIMEAIKTNTPPPCNIASGGCSRCKEFHD